MLTHRLTKNNPRERERDRKRNLDLVQLKFYKPKIIFFQNRKIIIPITYD